MHLQLKGKIEINAPADKVWQVIAHNYGDIGQWAVMIPASSAITDIPALDGAPVAGRVCSAQGFGDVREQFTYYDEQAKRFGYIAVEGLPSFMSRAENNWSVRSLGPEKSEVAMRGR
ncbi:MAG TPA: SRPBCC family protein [Chloroflexi bacterium]|nr:SRPBCC family protein [Chloroflexota bacterium]